MSAEDAELTELLAQLRAANFFWAATFPRKGDGYVVRIGPRDRPTANARGWSPNNLTDATVAALANYSRRAGRNG
ncbi:MAG TPA: hypothetical protein VJA25_09015 [Dehalococcoidia bacterium]|nr:hypothetical protein [Dehalococcoidia bacterium]